MLSRRITLALSLIACGLAARGVRAQEAAVESPRWTYELRGAYFEPDLEQFATFYGDDTDSLLGIAGTYRLRDWLELGGEYGWMEETGVGLLTETGTLGGTVELRLNPAHVFANYIFQRAIDQRVVPYVGAGLMVMRYEQKVDFQDDIEGRTDAGWSARAGVRFLIKTHEPTSRSSGAPYWRALAFFEAQHMSAEVDDIDLGGDAVVVGFRMEFELN
ncbi:MAG TPA: outer membrane beta-barrel protein [Gammaproteobacteria bacterium]|nr:outer membrane beta-barrel protein [Gammaproteobacteria bacterium]